MTTVIVGAGAAGLACAKHLRELDPARAIHLIDKDPDAPYDRPPLSKGLTGQGPAGSGLRDLTDAAIHVHIGTATRLESDVRTIHTDTGPIEYDELVLAPGSRPLRAPWASDAVLALHSLADNRRLRAAVANSDRAIVVGGGFIGAELAASLNAAQVSTTLLFRDGTLFRSRLGTEVSGAISDWHTSAGVALVGDATVDAVTGRPDTATRVTLTDGRHFDADLVVAGVGSKPDTGWLAGSGMLGEDGHIMTDASLRTALPAVWAAGDSASWADADGGLVRSAHWTTARSQGRHIASDIAAEATTRYREEPYFWSLQHGNLLQGVGRIQPHASRRDVTRTPASRDGLLARYVVDGHLVGAVGLNDPQGFLSLRAELADELRPAASR
ncbi:FAD/NAD(P)-binding oxidoreductase [Nocardioides sp. NPDC023903]|uniref:NAD(P)/FAD-dependent oxidoreductase n=1 Tax=Nocardioides sp. NPDC023903 TaxID=3157195 RepID=UPI0033DFD41F